MSLNVIFESVKHYKVVQITTEKITRHNKTFVLSNKAIFYINIKVNEKRPANKLLNLPVNEVKQKSKIMPQRQYMFSSTIRICTNHTNCAMSHAIIVAQPTAGGAKRHYHLTHNPMQRVYCSSLHMYNVHVRLAALLISIQKLIIQL